MKHLLTSLVAVAAIVSSSPAGAQTGSAPGRSARPYRGLFGGGVGDTEQSLTVNGGIGADYGTRFLAGAAASGPLAPGDPSAPQAMFGSMSGGLNYSLSKTRASMNANASTVGRYRSGNYLGAHSGGLGVSLMLSRRAQVTGSYGVSYQPFYSSLAVLPIADPLAGEFVSPDLNLGVSDGEQLFQDASASFVRNFGRRSSANVRYMRNQQDVSGAGDASSWSAGGGFSFGLTRSLNAHAGYSYGVREFDQDLQGRFESHSIDVGLDLNRTLSLTRRTKLTFTTGSTAIGDRSGYRYFVTGQATLTREIGRSWRAALDYNRNVRFVARFRDPFLADSVTASLNGLLSRRLQFHSSAGVSYAKVGLRNTGSNETYTGATGVSLAITRNLALSTDYAYYRYQFTNAVALPTDLPFRAGRHSARVYLSVWAPLFSRSRRPDATR